MHFNVRNTTVTLSMLAGKSFSVPGPPASVPSVPVSPPVSSSKLVKITQTAQNTKPEK